MTTPPGALFRGICVAHARRGPVDKLGKTDWAGCHFETQALPEFDVPVEPGGEVGRDIIDSSGAGKGYLHGIEVSVDSRHGQVYRAELAD